MSKKLLSDNLAVVCDLTALRAREVVGIIFGTADEPGILEEVLASGEHVVLSGFGTLEVVPSAERKVRNIRTGEQRVRPPGRRVRFRAGKSLKRRLGGQEIQPG